MSDNTSLLLKEQHRNTRHDAVEKINEIVSRWEKTHTFISPVNDMINEITGAIFNLKQREPK